MILWIYYFTLLLASVIELQLCCGAILKNVDDKPNPRTFVF